jgi:hypothetical protein
MSEINVKNEITSKIKSGQIKMKPRWYFVLGSVLLFQGTFAVILMGVFVFNLCFYHLRNYGPFGYLFLGKAGITPFMATFPWKLLLIALVSLVTGYKLLKKYEFSYSRHSVHIFLLLMVAILLSGLVADLAGFNERFRQNRFLHPIYSERFLSHDWMMGEIRQETSEGFVVETPRGDLVRVRVDKDTVTPYGKDFKEGRRVRIVGSIRNAASPSAVIFEAKGVGLDEGMRWRRYQMMQGNRNLPEQLFIVK